MQGTAPHLRGQLAFWSRSFIHHPLAQFLDRPYATHTRHLSQGPHVFVGSSGTLHTVSVVSPLAFPQPLELLALEWFSGLRLEEKLVLTSVLGLWWARCHLPRLFAPHLGSTSGLAPLSLGESGLLMTTGHPSANFTDPQSSLARAFAPNQLGLACPGRPWAGLSPGRGRAQGVSSQAPGRAFSAL